MSFEDLPAGSPEVSTDRGENGQTAAVEGGKQSELAITLPRGFDVEGIVVDEAGAPVAGAEIVLDQSVSRPGGRAVAVSARDGTFGVRSVRFALGIGARGPGFAPSLLADLASEFFLSTPGSASRAGARRVRLVLARGGAALQGRVVGPDDEPIAGALVLLGGEDLRKVRVPLEGDDYGVPPTAFLARSAADGSFRLPSLPARLLAVTARARGFAVWRGRFAPDDAETSLVIRLERGVTISGVVSDPKGKPIEHALVRVGDEYRFGTSQAATGLNGAYAINHVAAGEIRLSAEFDPAIVPKSFVEAPDRTIAPTSGLIRGEVLDIDRTPAADVPVVVFDMRDGAPHSQASQRTQTDEQGRFSLNVPTPLAWKIALVAFKPMRRPATLIIDGEQADPVTLALGEGAAIEGVVRVDGHQPRQGNFTMLVATSGSLIRFSTGRISADIRFGVPGCFSGNDELWWAGTAFETKLAAVSCDAEGKFRIAGLARDTYRIDASNLVDDSGLNLDVRADVTAPATGVELGLATARLRIRLEGNGRVLRGGPRLGRESGGPRDPDRELRSARVPGSGPASR